MTRLNRYLLCCCVFLLAACEQKPDQTEPDVILQEDATVVLRNQTVPFSSYASKESRQWMLEKQTAPKVPSALSFREGGKAVEEFRLLKDKIVYQPLLNKQIDRYDVKISEAQIAGLSVYIVDPKGQKANAEHPRVLINLHGGSYVEGAGAAQLIESVPIAALSGIRVISVDYPLAPENVYPTAVNKVIELYQILLKDYDARSVGIYGCSAGGALTGQVLAHLIDRQIPLPAAAGILCEGMGLPFGAGDGAYMSHLLNGRTPPSLLADPTAQMDRVQYFKAEDLNDPLAFPIKNEQVYARFPPVVFVTGTRAHEMSNVAHAHMKMSLSGIDSQLYIWDGQEHNFLYNADLPEARQAYELIARFFAQKLSSPSNK